MDEIVNYKTSGRTAPKKQIISRDELLYGRKRRIYSLSKKQKRILRNSKTPVELVNVIKESVKIANDISNNILVERGIKTFDIQVKNVYCLERSDFNEISLGSDTEAEAIYGMNSIIIDVSNYIFLDIPGIIFHEILHLKAFLCHKYSSGIAEIVQAGLELTVGESEYFTGLDESIVCYLEKRYFLDYFLNNKYVKKYHKKVLETLNNRTPQLSNFEKNDGLMKGDIYLVSSKEEYLYFSGTELRKTLFVITEKIALNHLILSQKDVYDFFVTAHFTGNLYPIARLISQTFGPDSFKLLGAMSYDENSAIIFRDIFIKKFKKFNK